MIQGPKLHVCHILCLHSWGSLLNVSGNLLFIGAGIYYPQKLSQISKTATLGTISTTAETPVL